MKFYPIKSYLQFKYRLNKYLVHYERYQFVFGIPSLSYEHTNTHTCTSFTSFTAFSQSFVAYPLLITVWREELIIHQLDT